MIDKHPAHWSPARKAFFRGETCGCDLGRACEPCNFCLSLTDIESDHFNFGRNSAVEPTRGEAFGRLAALWDREDAQAKEQCAVEKSPGQIAFDRWHAGRVSTIDGRKVTSGVPAWDALNDEQRNSWEHAAAMSRDAATGTSAPATGKSIHDAIPAYTGPGPHNYVTGGPVFGEAVPGTTAAAVERTNAEKTPGEREFEKRAAPGYSWDALPPEAKEKWEKLASTLGVFAAKPVIAVPVGRDGEQRDDIAEFAWKHSRRHKGLFNPRLGPTPRRRATVFDGGDICAAMAATVQQTASHITGTRTVYLDTAPGEAEMRAFEKEAKVSGVIFGMDLADGPDCTMAMLMTSAGIAQAFHVLLGSTKNENR